MSKAPQSKEGGSSQEPEASLPLADEIALRLSVGGQGRKRALGIGGAPAHDLSRRLATLARAGNVSLEWRIRPVRDDPGTVAVACGCNCGCTCGCYCYAFAPRDPRLLRALEVERASEQA
jgi:hypothetical protein